MEFIWQDIIITDPFVEEKVKVCDVCEKVMTHQVLTRHQF